MVIFFELNILEEIMNKVKIAKQLAKIAKTLIAGPFGDQDLAIELKEDLVDLIKKKRISESNVKNLVKKYDKVKYDYLDIDLVIDELDQFAKFNEQYDSDVNKVCKILERL